MTPTSDTSPNSASKSPRPAASSAQTRRRMQATRQRDTAPELALRRELHRRGYRYRVDGSPLPELRRRADLLFTRWRLAIYVDGCFWHSCPVHATIPKTNTDWWQTKLETNQRRDRDTDLRLRTAGWSVLRFWEHTPTADAADEVEDVLHALHPRCPS